MKVFVVFDEIGADTKERHCSGLQELGAGASLVPCAESASTFIFYYVGLDETEAKAVLDRLVDGEDVGGCLEHFIKG